MRRELYVGWVAFYEGRSDAAYYDILLPRVMDDITRREGTRRVNIPQAPVLRLDVGREVDDVAQELCRNSESFHLIFIHADTDGRRREARIDSRGAAYCRAVRERCIWPPDRCLVLKPRHETEAWVLADPDAVMSALGVTGDPIRYGLPSTAAAAEVLLEPKGVLNATLRSVSRRKPRRESAALFASIAQRQSIEALRGSRSFQTFEADLRRALSSLGCL